MFLSAVIRRTLLGAVCSTLAMAHCDGIDGPVIADAKRALAGNNVDHALLWVRKTDEAAIRVAFLRTQEVRKLGGEAERLAEQFFFETLVRLHRAGEGAAYTGLKPAGRDLGPAIPAGDNALVAGDLKPAWDLLREEAHRGLHARFAAVQKARVDKDKDPESGRRFVAAYVDYIHYLAGLYDLAKGRREPLSSGSPQHSCGEAE